MTHILYRVDVDQELRTRKQTAIVSKIVAEHVSTGPSFPETPVVHFGVHLKYVDQVIKMTTISERIRKLSAIPRTPVITHGDGWQVWHEEPGRAGNDWSTIHMVMPTDYPRRSMLELRKLLSSYPVPYEGVGGWWRKDHFIVTDQFWEEELYVEKYP